MVVHDQENQERWAAERVAWEREKPMPSSSRSGGWSVLAIQSLACALVVALALLLRVAGGAAYEELRQGFQEALMRNELMSVISRLWDGEMELNGAENTEKGDAFTVEGAPQLSGFIHFGQ